MRDEEIKFLPMLVQKYLLYCEVTKGQSHLTVLEYASDLRTFFRFLSIIKGLVPPKCELKDIDISKIDIDFISSITLDNAYQYIIHCKNERKNNEATRARKVVSIRRFFKYICENLALMSDNPMKALEMPKIKKSLPKYLTLEESLKLLNSIDGSYKERDYCMITLFLNCGFRLSELVSINYTDIDDDNNLTILGKGNKERKIHLNEACMVAIKNYMATRPVDKVKSVDKKALFLSSRYQRISIKTVQFLVKSYIDKAGFGNRGLSVHKLRHTAATLMYQKGNVDLLILKEILGHENLGTTEIYTHLADEQLKNALDANPLAHVKQKN